MFTEKYMLCGSDMFEELKKLSSSGVVENTLSFMGFPLFWASNTFKHFVIGNTTYILDKRMSEDSARLVPREEIATVVMRGWY